MPSVVEILVLVLAALALQTPPPAPTVVGPWDACFRFDEDKDIQKCGVLTFTDTQVCRANRYHAFYHLTTVPVPGAPDSTMATRHPAARVPPDSGYWTWKQDGPFVTIEGTERAYGENLERCVLSDGGLAAHGRLEGDSIVGHWDWWFGYVGAIGQGSLILRRLRADP